MLAFFCELPSKRRRALPNNSTIQKGPMDVKPEGSPTPSSDQYVQAKTQPRRGGRRWGPLIIVGVAIIVILALALGLGLGLGLKKHHNNNSTASAPSNGSGNGTSSEESNASKEVQSW